MKIIGNGGLMLLPLRLMKRLRRIFYGFPCGCVPCRLPDLLRPSVTSQFGVPINYYNVVDLLQAPLIYKPIHRIFKGNCGA